MGRKKHRGSRRGFVLLFVLMTLLLVSAVVVGFSNHSMKVAAEALVKQQEMRTRWSTISSQRALMKRANELLHLNRQNSDDGGKLESKLAVRFRVGEVEFVGLIQDESAKLDLNLYSQLAKQEQAVEVTEKLLNSRQPIVQFDFIDERLTSTEVTSARLLAWDQVLRRADGSSLDPNELVTETDQLTLWGGKIHFKAATDLVLTESIKPLVGPIMAGRVVAIREDQPDLSWTDAKQQLNMTEQQATKLDRLIGNQSSCLSVWLVSRADNADQYSFLVRRMYADSVVRYYSYYW